MRIVRVLLCGLLVGAVMVTAGCFDRGGLDPVADGGLGGAGARGGAGVSGGRGGTGIGGHVASGGIPGSGGAGGKGGGGGVGTGGTVGLGGAPGTGGASVCPAIACGLVCPNGNPIDASGCPICKCNPMPCPPSTCMPCPAGMIVDPDGRDASGCSTCACVPSPACATTDCPLPAPEAPTILCSDGSVGGPVCQRGPNKKCDWKILTCPAGCGSFSDIMACTASQACRWLAPGCGTPALAAAGCYPRTGCNLNSECPGGQQCVKRVINPCFNSSCAACGSTVSLCQ